MLKKTLHLALATVTGAVLALAPSGPAQAADTDVYTVPGHHLVNGRYWQTECEKYSSTVVRCSTEIWAKKVVQHNGRYVSHEGWVFNNLTYLPSNRGDWTGNPLATPGTWKGDDGRSWRTECDTDATGRNGCRTYVVTTALSQTYDGIVSSKTWAVNNIVQFATSTKPAVTTIPAAAPALSGVPVEQPIRSSIGQQVVDYALSKVGSRYVYATAGPSTFDCSGLTSWAYRQVGIDLPRSSRTQYSAGTRISKSQLQPGDLVFYYSPISHVGIYVGNGKIVDAANPRTGVRTASLDSMPYAGAVRVTG
ncbi:C40 family peptidase [Tessaracoccus flavus]|uniref:Uncharacterized protein n=1 Tax=Tessaracoccus flavus TaxID=1610493 RepID=A0A1Q2CCC7_9ACTN|nr:C40 family peptidase [Tessaracoccus flavus]AQP43751.1 hypothetical protein RPIT_02100 [Tessaracoccus flavus]SDY22800.1 Cell wall-associated hydrolase, NlpC family [Tessaracoccus flavus]